MPLSLISASVLDSSHASMAVLSSSVSSLPLAALVLLPILVLVLFVLLSTGSFTLRSQYECGFAPFSDPHSLFHSRFFLVALLFLLFDLEISCLVPAVLSSLWFLSSSWSFFVLLAFLLILSLGFILEWAWSQQPSLGSGLVALWCFVLLQPLTLLVPPATLTLLLLLRCVASVPLLSCSLLLYSVPAASCLAPRPAYVCLAVRVPGSLWASVMRSSALVCYLHALLLPVGSSSLGSLHALPAESSSPRFSVPQASIYASLLLSVPLFPTGLPPAFPRLGFPS